MSKKTVLITGCSDGTLGGALAKAFHIGGYRVFAAGRTFSKMKEAEDAGIELVKLDVLSDESIQDCVSEVSKLTGGSLNMLINNAGATNLSALTDLKIEAGKKMFDLNVWSYIAVTQAFIPLLMESTSGASIVHHTSLMGEPLPLPMSAAYAASKAAICSFSDSMRLELGIFGIKVHDLRSGMVQSRIFEVEKYHMPEDSLYNFVKPDVEKAYDFLTGQWFYEHETTADAWAANVFRDLNRRNPSYFIRRGRGTTFYALGSSLPHGACDWGVMKFVGLDQAKQKYKVMKSTARK